MSLKGSAHQATVNSLIKMSHTQLLRLLHRNAQKVALAIVLVGGGGGGGGGSGGNGGNGGNGGGGSSHGGRGYRLFHEDKWARIPQFFPMSLSNENLEEHLIVEDILDMKESTISSIYTVTNEATAEDLAHKFDIMDVQAQYDAQDNHMISPAPTRILHPEPTPQPTAETPTAKPTWWWRWRHILSHLSKQVVQARCKRA